MTVVIDGVSKVTASHLERDWTQPYERNPDLVEAFRIVYEDPERWRRLIKAVHEARAKGLHESSVVLRHILRNAILPIITLVGLDIRDLHEAPETVYDTMTCLLKTREDKARMTREVTSRLLAKVA